MQKFWNLIERLWLSKSLPSCHHHLMEPFATQNILEVRGGPEAQAGSTGKDAAFAPPAHLPFGLSAAGR